MSDLPAGDQFIIAERLWGRWQASSNRIVDRTSAEAMVANEPGVVAVPVPPDLAAALEASRAARAASHDRDDRMVQGHVNRFLACQEVPG